MKKKETGSEFGQGFTYNLALFICHFSNSQTDLIKKLKFLMDKSDEEREKILNKTDDKHNYGRDMDHAIIYWKKILPIWKTPERLLSEQITLWANGATDHLYDLRYPENLEGTYIAKAVVKLITNGLAMGHGFHDTIYTFEDFVELQKLAVSILKHLDKSLGVDQIDATWGEL